MDKNIISENEIRDELRALVNEYGTVTKLAAALDTGAQYIFDVLACRRSVSKGLASKIGYKRVYAYAPKPDTWHPIPAASERVQSPDAQRTISDTMESAGD